MPMGYPPGYMPMQPGYPPGYGQPYPGQPYPGQPMMPSGYSMPPHPAMVTSPLPEPIAAPAAPTATPQAIAGSVPTPATPAPALASPPTRVAPVAAAPKPVAPVAAPVVAMVPAAPVEMPPDDGLPHPFHPEAAHDFGPAPKRSGFVELWRKIGGGSLTLSIAIHAGVLIVAGLVVFTSTQIQKNVDFLPGGGTAQGAQASQDLQHKMQQKRRSTIAKTTPMKKVVSNSNTSSISLPDAPPDILDVPDVSSMMGGGSLGGGGFGKGGAGGGFGNGMGAGAAGGFVMLPPTMKARCSPAERLEKLRQNGGNSECEAAVSKSLEWLKTKQDKDGFWGKQHKAGMTGLSLLCYLGRCETPESPFYGDNVMKGIMYLIELGKKNPWDIMAENPQVGPSCYEHGIATYALGEMYTLARLGSKSLPGMREAFEKGVKRIIDNQLPDGGWGYGEGGEFCYRTTGKGDLSVTGWQYQALKAAKHTGLKIPHLHEAIAKTVKYLEASQTKDGGFGVTNRDAGYNQWNLSGCGILGLLTLGNNKTVDVNKGIKFLNEYTKAEPLDWNKNANLYCWYYFTQAYFQKGGDDWKAYNEQFLPQVLNNQGADGQWKEERFNSSIGSTAPAGADRVVYRQALCTLMLEVYYRYLKVGDREEQSFLDR